MLNVQASNLNCIQLDYLFKHELLFYRILTLILFSLLCVNLLFFIFFIELHECTDIYLCCFVGLKQKGNVYIEGIGVTESATGLT